jgi:hypothetical protein
MKRNYNFIYSKLVKNDSDLIGHIAYSLYKKSKVEYIEKQKESGNSPTDSDLVPFNDFSSTDSSLEGYRLKAEVILQGFIENVLEEELESYKKQVISNQTDILKEVIKPLVTPLWKNILIGVISSFVFAVISVTFYFVITYGNYSIKIKIEPPTKEERFK